LETQLGPLSKAAKLLTAVVSMESLARWVPARRAWTGRPACDRLSLATAFFAKAVYNLSTTRHLRERLQTDTQLRRLCGWDRAEQVPAEATFSRAFAEFAAAGLPARVHEALVRSTLGEECIEYVARDSTAIEAREHLPEDYLENQRRKQQAAAAPKPKRDRYQKYPGHRRGAKPGPHKRARAKDRGSLLQRQQHMSLPEMLATLPRQCSLGVKTSSKGQQQYWRGYKLHWDVSAAGRIPISCILTAASVHDSQVAIPLMQLSAQRINWRCDVMDSAYDAKLIRSQAAQLGHEALIQPAARTGLRNATIRAFTEDDKQRFRKRTVIEQLNARLKDEFGGRLIYLRGARKIMAHLMFGIVALTVDQLLRLSG
jgi:hypothetical protein